MVQTYTNSISDNSRVNLFGDKGNISRRSDLPNIEEQSESINLFADEGNISRRSDSIIYLLSTSLSKKTLLYLILKIKLIFPSTIFYFTQCPLTHLYTIYDSDNHMFLCML